MKFLSIFFLLFIASCQHLEQDEADVDFRGDKFYGKPFDQGIKFSEEQLFPSSIIAYPGQSIKQIADDNNVNVEDLMALNNIKQDNLEFSDAKKINLPNYIIHKVKPAQTVYMLSRLYKVNPHSIIESNNLPKPYLLEIGQVIKIEIDRVGTNKDEESIPITKANKELNKIKKPETIKKAPKGTKIVSSEELKPISSTPVKFAGEYIWPTKGKIISGLGKQPDGTKNDGVIIAAPSGTIVKSIESGTVVYAGDNVADFGNMIIIKHPNNMYSTYAHQNSIVVRKGDEVSRGQIIGKVGSTGNVAFPQLYFSIRKGKKLLDPLKMIKRS